MKWDPANDVPGGYQAREVQRTVLSGSPRFHPIPSGRSVSHEHALRRAKACSGAVKELCLTL